MSILDDYKKEKEQLAIEYMNEGKESFLNNRLNEAALLMQNAINLFKELHSYENLILSLNSMGVIYGAIGNETSAMDYFLEGLSYAMDYHFYNYTCLLYNNIGSRYQQLNSHEQAIEYFLRSETALESADIDADEHAVWFLVTFLNLANSYNELQCYELAEKYLNKAGKYLKDDIFDNYHYTFLIVQCRLYWCTERKDFVRSHLDKLMESGENDKNTSDYIQDMLTICSLLKEMEEYDNWKMLISCVKEYAKKQNSIYLLLIVTEMWMHYYKTVGDMTRYCEACVSYAELCQKQKAITDREKASAIDIKIALCEKENERKIAEHKANNDSLTGLGNRYLMEADILAKIKSASAKQSPITIGILDIDCFKQLNDTYGHIQGDKCLKTVADILKASVCERGHAYRFGGDEFILLLETNDSTVIESIAKNIQLLLHEANFENINSTVIPELSMSQGYACFVPSQDETVKKAIQHADSALYEVKRNGKNSYKIIMEE